MMAYSILNVSQNHHIIGGSDKYFFSLAELLNQNGHTVIPFTAHHPNNLPSVWSRYFPHTTNFESPTLKDVVQYIYSVSAQRSLQRLLSEVSINIAHLHIYYGKLTSSILAPLQQANIPIIQTLHEYKLICPVYTLMYQGKLCEACQGKHFWYATLKRCNRGSWLRSLLSTVESSISSLLGAVDKVDHFITVSRFQQQKLIEYGIPAAKLSTIHNYVDTASIQPSTYSGSYFLYFGRLEKLKGILTLIEAAAPLRDTPLLLAGEGQAKAQIQQIIEEQRLSHIHLVGMKHGQELEDLIRHSICTVLPSEWYENCPMSVLESQAFGKPVIGTNIGGIPELVNHEDDGFLVPVNDPESLRQRLAWMAQYPLKAVELGQRARRKVESTFSPALHYEKLQALYQSVL